MFDDVSINESMSGRHWSGLDLAGHVAFKQTLLLRRKHKKPKLHNGPEPCHVVALLCHECGKSQIFIRRGGSNCTTLHRHTREQDISMQYAIEYH